MIQFSCGRFKFPVANMNHQLTEETYKNLTNFILQLGFDICKTIDILHLFIRAHKMEASNFDEWFLIVLIRRIYHVCQFVMTNKSFANMRVLRVVRKKNFLWVVLFHLKSSVDSTPSQFNRTTIRLLVVVLVNFSIKVRISSLKTFPWSCFVREIMNSESLCCCQSNQESRASGAYRENSPTN